MTTALDIYQTFQETIVGLFGFIGIIITLVANSYLTHRSRQAEIEDTRKMVAQGIRTELLLFSSQLKNIVDSSKDEPLMVPYKIPLIDATVFRGVSNNIGLLDQDASQSIIEAYVHYNAINNNTELFIKHHDAIPKGEWYKKSSIHEEWIKMLSEAKNKIDKAAHLLRL